MGFRIIKKLLCIWLLILSLNLSIQSTAWADCRALSGEELIKNADIIFYGKALEVKRSLKSIILFWEPNHYATFSTDGKYKGNLQSTVDIYYNSGAPRGDTAPIKPGDSYLVMSKKDPKGRYRIPPCQTNIYHIETLNQYGANEQTIATFKALQADFPNIKNEEISRISMAVVK